MDDITLHVHETMHFIKLYVHLFQRMFHLTFYKSISSVHGLFSAQYLERKIPFLLR